MRKRSGRLLRMQGSLRSSAPEAGGEAASRDEASKACEGRDPRDNAGQLRKKAKQTSEHCVWLEQGMVESRNVAELWNLRFGVDEQKLGTLSRRP